MTLRDFLSAAGKSFTEAGVQTQRAAEILALHPDESVRRLAHLKLHLKNRDWQGLRETIDVQAHGNSDRAKLASALLDRFFAAGRVVNNLMKEADGLLVRRDLSHLRRTLGKEAFADVISLLDEMAIGPKRDEESRRAAEFAEYAESLSRQP